MNKKAVDAVLLRLMSLFNVDNDSELARVLNVNRQTLASWRKRDSVPYSICINIAEERGVSLDWLLTGKGEEEVSKVESVTQSFSQADLKMLELLNQLDPEVRRDLMRGAEEKQRVIEMEKQIQELSAQLNNLKNVG
ncbi:MULTISPECIES: helix-turn-helix transcriptional regulator [Enterobacteriaceae]|jgi:transcriptional regulator with XRE-family HTH domain|uniref:helix-turn-helix transcriptional regulator n=1 Tax=Enterobacteriaceae TaxID=543 RepID=UPI000FEBF8DA|nr:MULTISPECIES: helix-turn-helix transcriptional regulator [Enterobacteriaceae]ELS5369241.1 helix-turn-helix domain containing protein [Citrobacter freundii]RWS60245.1 phage repressor protein [Enterobacter cloacae]HBM7656442.1 helix-turn-helix domain containing protein [Enterobacter cloacae subsp. cloacae]HBR6422536.1 helix-turn-helix domain containing protein [Klebsiella pneumoniae]HDS4024972.1 helix-turn-helix domain containing protein [Klebsiella aerogenes]HDS5670237.1 helix-turn-helix do